MELEDEKTTEALENIFMPNMVKMKNKVLDLGNKYVHYTSAENALNILKSKRLWLRNPSCMNDYMEISHGHQMLLNFFNDAENRKSFVEAIDAYEEGIADQIFNEFDGWWAKIRHDTFIASISVHTRDEDQHGRLSMWRAYGSQNGKAALILNNPPKRSKNLGVILSPAAYFTNEELISELRKIISEISNNMEYLKPLRRETIIGAMVVALIILAVCLKHPGFKEEQEWRLIYLPTLLPDNKWLLREVETINGVPQVVYKMPLENSEDLEISGLSIPELVDRILIGPTQYPLAMFDAFRDVLADLGVNASDGKVSFSGIPLRT